MKRVGNYSFDRPWLRREVSPCANRSCDWNVIGEAVFRGMSREQRAAQHVRKHGGMDLCSACHNRWKRNGTTDYQPKPRGPKPKTAAEPCLGGCGRTIVSAGVRATIPRAERRAKRIVLHGARGLCEVCVRQAKANNTYDDFEPRRRTNDEVLAEWDLLRTEGVIDLGVAAARMGMTRKALDKAIYRGARRGDPRAVRPHPNLRSAA
jgi:hypothetical protein